MKTTYQNRYGDNIVFEKINDKTVIMSGYNPEWIRIGYTNVYDDAYKQFKIDNPSSTMTIKDFTHKISTDELLYNMYGKLISTDYNTLSMVDPSGGPCIFIGGNLNRYFNESKDMIIKKITTNKKHAIFEI